MGNRSKNYFIAETILSRKVYRRAYLKFLLHLHAYHSHNRMYRIYIFTLALFSAAFALLDISKTHMYVCWVKPLLNRA